MILLLTELGLLSAWLVWKSRPLPFVDDPDPQPEEPKEPWRDGPHGESSWLIPVSLLVSVADATELTLIHKRELQETLGLAADIMENGLREPLVMVIDELGRIGLWDGHHRLAASIENGDVAVPVRIEQSSRLKKYSRPLYEFVPELLSMVAKPSPRTGPVF